MGKPSSKAQQALARRVARLRRDGLTNREIADLTGLNVKNIPKRVILGERLLCLEENNK